MLAPETHGMSQPFESVDEGLWLAQGKKENKNRNKMPPLLTSGGQHCRLDIVIVKTAQSFSFRETVLWSFWKLSLFSLSGDASHLPFNGRSAMHQTRGSDNYSFVAKQHTIWFQSGMLPMLMWSVGCRTVKCLKKENNKNILNAFLWLLCCQVSQIQIHSMSSVGPQHGILQGQVTETKTAMDSKGDF